MEAKVNQAMNDPQVIEQVPSHVTLRHVHPPKPYLPIPVCPYHIPSDLKILIVLTYFYNSLVVSLPRFNNPIDFPNLIYLRASYKKPPTFPLAFEIKEREVVNKVI